MWVSIGPPWRELGSRELSEGDFDDVEDSRTRAVGECVFLEDEKDLFIGPELIIRR